MKTYKVIRATVGYKGRYWNEGEIVELEDSDTPPIHFELVKGTQPKIKPKTDEIAFSQVGIPPKPTHGFAYQAEETAPKRMSTFSDSKKTKKK